MSGDTSIRSRAHRLYGSWTASYQSAIAPSVENEFYYPGTRHGSLVVAALSATPGLASFLSAQLSGDPAWATVEP